MLQLQVYKCSEDLQEDITLSICKSYAPNVKLPLVRMFKHALKTTYSKLNVTTTLHVRGMYIMANFTTRVDIKINHVEITQVR